MIHKWQQNFQWIFYFSERDGANSIFAFRTYIYVFAAVARCERKVTHGIIIGKEEEDEDEAAAHIMRKEDIASSPEVNSSEIFMTFKLHND